MVSGEWSESRGEGLVWGRTVVSHMNVPLTDDHELKGMVAGPLKA